MKTGWWKLEITGVDELNDTDRGHVSRLVQQGYTEGKIIQEDEVPEIKYSAHEAKQRVRAKRVLRENGLYNESMEYLATSELGRLASQLVGV